MTEALFWWLLTALLGALAFPVAFAFLPGLADRGYAFARVLGLLLVSYALWMAGTIGILPNERWSIALLIAGLGAVSAFVYRRRRADVFRRELAGPQ